MEINKEKKDKTVLKPIKIGDLKAILLKVLIFEMVILI